MFLVFTHEKNAAKGSSGREMVSEIYFSVRNLIFSNYPFTLCALISEDVFKSALAILIVKFELPL